MNSNRIDYSKLVFLDGLRGLAALYVMIGHARWLLWEGFTSFRTHSEVYPIWDQLQAYGLLFFRYGHEAVLFFFVLSGFVIHLKYAHKITQDSSVSFDWRRYFYRRARRIYPPFLLAMLVTWVVDSMGQQLQLNIYASETLYPLINQNISIDHSLPTLFGNLVFWMEAYVPVWGSNGPLWSLKYEWWFYVLYPLFFLLTRRSNWIAMAVMAGLFLLSLLPDVWPILLFQQIFGLMLSWWFGATLAEIYTGKLAPKIQLLQALIIGITLLIAFSFAGLSNPILKDTLVGVVFSGLLLLLFRRQKKGLSLKLLERLKPLGDLSYTLYVTHFPLMVLMSGLLMARSTDGSLPSHFGFVWLGIVLTLLFSYVAHLVVERPFVSKRKG